MSGYPSLLTASNAICAPSGDQARSHPETPAPTCLTSLPSAFITAITPVVYRVVEKAMFRLSGDHVGPESEAGSVVSRAKLVPSGFMRYSSECPSRVVIKAILPPSGDHAGS